MGLRGFSGQRETHQVQTVSTDLASGAAPHLNAGSCHISGFGVVIKLTAPTSASCFRSQDPGFLLLGSASTQLDAPDTIENISGSSQAWAERTKSIVDPHT